MRELNIPYESDSQKEHRFREEEAQKRLEKNMSSTRWNNESLEKKYTIFEILTGLVYYYVCSLFPDYIDRELDIFQREYNMIETKRRIRELKRQAEIRRKEAEDKIKEEQKLIEEHDRKNLAFVPKKVIIDEMSDEEDE